MIRLDQLFARRDFPLPSFELPPLEFDDAAGEADELLLDEVIVQIAPPPRAELSPPLPTAGQLRESIERHLRGESRGGRRADAADELRHALAELRRSLG